MDKGTPNVPFWDTTTTRILCEICAEEAEANNMPSTYLTPIDYHKFSERFYARTGRKCSKDQFKNQWYSLKKDYQIWKSLLLNLGWDPKKETICANKDWWEREIEKMPDCAKFRYAPLENTNCLKIMFGDSTLINASSPIYVADLGGLTTSVAVDDLSDVDRLSAFDVGVSRHRKINAKQPSERKIVSTSSSMQLHEVQNDYDSVVPNEVYLTDAQVSSVCLKVDDMHECNTTDGVLSMTNESIIESASELNKVLDALELSKQMVADTMNKLASKHNKICELAEESGARYLSEELLNENILELENELLVMNEELQANLSSLKQMKMKLDVKRLGSETTEATANRKQTQVLGAKSEPDDFSDENPILQADDVHVKAQLFVLKPVSHKKEDDYEHGQKLHEPKAQMQSAYAADERLKLQLRETQKMLENADKRAFDFEQQLIDSQTKIISLCAEVKLLKGGVGEANELSFTLQDLFVSEHEKAFVKPLSFELKGKVLADFVSVPGWRKYDERKKDRVKKKLETASAFLKFILLGATDLVFRLHREKQSLNGQFSLKDFYLLPNRKIKLGDQLKTIICFRSHENIRADYAALCATAREEILSELEIPVPSDIEDLLKLMLNDPVRDECLIRYNSALMDNLSKNSHFLTMFERFCQIQKQDKHLHGNNIAAYKSTKVLQFINLEEYSFRLVIEFNEYLSEIEKFMFAKFSYERHKMIFITKEGLLEFVRHSLHHLLDYSFDSQTGIFRFHDKDLFVIIGSCFPRVLHEFQAGMHSINELEIPHLNNTMKA